MKIAVYGKLRAGKSEVCKGILNYLPKAQLLDFGDALKECVAIAYPASTTQPKNRELLINFGQHLRKLDKEIWVNALKYKIENSNAEDIIVTGIRQQNEYDMLKENGFTFIEVVACEETRIERCIANGDIFKKENLNDSTEVEMDNFKADFTIRNEGDFKELDIEILNVLADIITLNCLSNEWA